MSNLGKGGGHDSRIISKKLQSQAHARGVANANKLHKESVQGSGGCISSILPKTRANKAKELISDLKVLFTLAAMGTFAIWGAIELTYYIALNLK